MGFGIGRRVDTERINVVYLAIDISDQREEGVDDRVEQAMRYPVCTWSFFDAVFGENSVQDSFGMF